MLTAVFSDPFRDTRKVLVLLPNVILHTKIDQVEYWLRSDESDLLGAVKLARHMVGRIECGAMIAKALLSLELTNFLVNQVNLCRRPGAIAHWLVSFEHL